MSEKLNIKDINFIDLFAGCGGLSEGFYKDIISLRFRHGGEKITNLC